MLPGEIDNRVISSSPSSKTSASVSVTLTSLLFRVKVTVKSGLAVVPSSLRSIVGGLLTFMVLVTGLLSSVPSLATIEIERSPEVGLVAVLLY